MTKSDEVVKNASEFVASFLKKHAKSAVPAWNASEVQDSLKTLFPAGTTTRRKNSQTDLPKRGKSAYLFFCQDMRQRVKEGNPDLTSKAVTIELGLLWNKMKDDELSIAKYVTQASKDRARYEREKKEMSEGEGSGASTPPAKAEKAPRGAPKAEKVDTPAKADKPSKAEKIPAAPKVEKTPAADTKTTTRGKK